MKSYASIDRIEGKWAVCEVELHSVEESLNLDVFEKLTEMIDVEVDIITQSCGDVIEGDILIVEHDCTNIKFVYEKDDTEKERRIELLKEIMKN